MTTTTKTALIITAVVLVFLAVGGQDYQDAERDAATYCANVKSGAWPDYQGNAKEVCK